MSATRTLKRLACHIVGHRTTRVTATHPASGRYYSHPNGERTACRRCRRVLAAAARGGQTA